ncbi:MAG: ATP-binding cassette domain-containing protein [Anaerolineae bacterium]|nr:ATP-binding cassette domain-containing protein [Anaerolineae bacterium]
MAFALEAQSVTKTYQVGGGTVSAVDEVSLSLQRGEFVALVGPSGSGKTTLLAMLAGLLSPTLGSIVIEGQELAAMKEARRARFRRRSIGFTFQANNLVSYLTALENVELMLRLNGEFNAAGRRRAKELLVRLGLEERMNALPRQLSGGQRQRVAIARALINQPALVLADEPTASLDTERAFQVVETLANLVHEQDNAGIMVTHDLRLVQYTDRVIQLLDGHVERIISPEEDLACLADPAECAMIPTEVLGFEEGEEETDGNPNRDG